MLGETQVSPAFVDVYRSPDLAAATSFVPSAEEATVVQSLDGALVCIHVPPELVEM
jgi:hypothetical protein